MSASLQRSRTSGPRASRASPAVGGRLCWAPAPPAVRSPLCWLPLRRAAQKQWRSPAAEVPGSAVQAGQSDYTCVNTLPMTLGNVATTASTFAVALLQSGMREVPHHGPAAPPEAACTHLAPPTCRSRSFPAPTGAQGARQGAHVAGCHSGAQHGVQTHQHAECHVRRCVPLLHGSCRHPNGTHDMNHSIGQSIHATPTNSRQTQA